MKNKLIILGTGIFAIFICFIAGSETLQGKTSLTSQHIVSKTKEVCENDALFCSHLPLVTINTHNQPIPGEARDGSTILSDIAIIDNEKKGNHVDDEPELKTKANIRYRGNSSMHFDKKGYLLKFVDDEGQERKEKVLGMEKNDEWALHGPFLDKTLLRNYLWYHIASEIMDSAPNSVFCELFVDGEYQGVYVLLETPSRGDKARMPISKYDPDKPYTSYIVKLDKGDKSQDNNLNTFTKYTYNMPLVLELIYPGKSKVNQDIIDYVEKDFSKFEKALYSYDYKDEKKGYKKYINVDSFVDYYIINEFTLNYDAGNMSTYLYKDAKGKLNMYVWDFNSANNYYDSEMNVNDFEFQWNTWYYMLLKDEDFANKIILRYKYLRNHSLNTEYLLNYIDEIVEYLGPAIDRNYEKWGYSFDEEYDLIKPAERNVRSYDEAIKQIKENIALRGKILDKNIDTIKQYSHESKVKKFNR